MALGKYLIEKRITNPINPPERTDSSMELKRGAGVLLNISSLPGPYGIGVFGEEAKDFL